MEETNLDDLKIPEELLESVSGGTNDENLIRQWMKTFKNKGYDKAAATELFRQTFWSEQPQLPESWLTFIDEIWDQLPSGYSTRPSWQIPS